MPNASSFAICVCIYDIIPIMIYDVVVIGGGIAGLSSAFFLQLNGAKVAIVDKKEIMQGASAAAGAFLHPVMGKPSNVKKFSDAAYLFSIDFYKKYCDYEPIGAFVGAKDEKSADEFKKLGEYIVDDSEFIESPKEFNSDGCGAFFVKSAGRIPPSVVANMLFKNIDFICADGLNIVKQNDVFNIDSRCMAKKIVYACGASDFFHNKDYLKKAHRGVWGQKAIVKSGNLPINAMSIRGVLISEGFDGKVAIGATHVQSSADIDITREISYELLEKAKSFYSFGDASVVDEQGGMRSASTDYFPIVGKIYDDELAFKMYPQMKDGLNPRNLPIIDNVYVNYGHGSRGFTASIYTSALLCDLILNNKELPKEIDTKRLLLRFARKIL